MRRVIVTEALAIMATVVLFITAGPVRAQPQVSNVNLGALNNNQPDDQDLRVSYTLTGADAARTAVAWYRDGGPVMDLYTVFEGDAATGLLDFSGNGQTVVASGDVPAASAWDATGGHGGSGAYLFSASSGNRFYLDAGTVMSTSAYTKVLWLKRTGSSSSNNILSSNTTTGGHILFAGGSAGGKVTAFHVGQAVRVADPVTLVDGVWYHYAITYQASDGAMILYRNGVQVASGTAPAFTDQSLLIGSFTPTVNNQWEGYLDDVRIYDHVLSPEQIVALYNGPDTIRDVETTVGEVWYAELTPFSISAKGSTISSDPVTIVAPCCVLRGDINSDSSIDVADVTSLVAFMFKGGPPAPCDDHADVSNDNNINILDLTIFVSFQFKGGPAPSPCD